MGRKTIPGVTSKSFVVEGAELKCTLGMKDSKLMLPIGHGVYIHDKKQANIGDFKPMFNICPFGTCKLSSPPVPCIPMVVMNWINGKMDVEVDGLPGLLNTSFAVCSKGGMIKITDDGQL